MVGLGSGLGVRAHLGPCLVRRARSAWLYTFHTLCRTYSGEDLGIGLGIGLVLGRGLGLGRRLGLGCVLELGLVGPVVVQGGADGLEEHPHLPGARDVNAVYTQSICNAHAVYMQGACRVCMQRVHAWHMHMHMPCMAHAHAWHMHMHGTCMAHAWRMHGTCRAYMPHMPLVVPRLLCEHMVCLREELLDLRRIERLVLGVRVGVG